MEVHGSQSESQATSLAEALPSHTLIWTMATVLKLDQSFIYRMVEATTTIAARSPTPETVEPLEP